MKIATFFIFIMALCLAGRSWSESGSTNPTIPFEVSPSSSLGKKTIEENLLELQKQEINWARTKFGVSNKLEIHNFLQEKNQQLVNELNLLAKNENSPGINKQQAERLLSLVRNHPVVGPQAVDKYDSWDRNIGYCFGRAAFIHWELLRRGVAPEAIGKLFLVGNLKVDMKTGSFWEFHVATIVRDTDQGWWVIDPLVDKVLPILDWMNEMKPWAMDSKYPQIRFYFSDAIKMLPIPGAYSEKLLFFSAYKGYFKDLFKWFEENPVQSGDRFFSKNKMKAVSLRLTTNNLTKGEIK